jgi:hypothetical protein
MKADTIYKQGGTIIGEKPVLFRFQISGSLDGLPEKQANRARKLIVELVSQHGISARIKKRQKK